MNVEQVKKYCRSFSGADENEVGHPSNILSFSVRNKKFAYFKTSEPEIWRLSFRVTPDRFLELTDHPGVTPARYMYRFHWVTVVDVNTMNAKYLRELLDWSYNKAVSSLPKKVQNEVCV